MIRAIQQRLSEMRNAAERNEFVGGNNFKSARTNAVLFEHREILIHFVEVFQQVNSQYIKESPKIHGDVVSLKMKLSSLKPVIDDIENWRSESTKAYNFSIEYGIKELLVCTNIAVDLIQKMEEEEIRRGIY